MQITELLRDVLREAKRTSDHALGRLTAWVRGPLSNNVEDAESCADRLFATEAFRSRQKDDPTKAAQQIAYELSQDECVETEVRELAENWMNATGHSWFILLDSIADDYRRLLINQSALQGVRDFRSKVNRLAEAKENPEAADEVSLFDSYSVGWLLYEAVEDMPDELREEILELSDKLRNA